MAADVKPRPELKQFCEQMDAKGLLNFAMENQKNLYAIRDELSVALEIATEPARLVLDSLEGFYPPVETTQQMDKKDAALQGMRKSCVIFMEAMAALLARIDPGADHLLNPEIKQQAKAFADEWKPKLASAGTDATNGDPLEAEAFLQLFGVRQEEDCYRGGVGSALRCLLPGTGAVCEPQRRPTGQPACHGSSEDSRCLPKPGPSNGWCISRARSHSRVG